MEPKGDVLILGTKTGELFVITEYLKDIDERRLKDHKLKVHKEDLATLAVRHRGHNL